MFDEYYNKYDLSFENDEYLYREFDEKIHYTDENFFKKDELKEIKTKSDSMRANQ